MDGDAEALSQRPDTGAIHDFPLLWGCFSELSGSPGWSLCGDVTHLRLLPPAFQVPTTVLHPNYTSALTHPRALFGFTLKPLLCQQFPQPFT